MKLRLPNMKNLFSHASAGGNRRIFGMAFVLLSVLGIVLWIGMRPHRVEIKSDPGRAANISALPGGTHDTPLQEKMRKEDNEKKAAQAEHEGRSWGPDIAPGKVVHPDPEKAVAATPPPVPQEVGYSQPIPAPAPVGPHIVAQPPPATIQTDPAYAAPVSATTGQPMTEQEEKEATARRGRYQRAIMELGAQIVGTPPVTVVQDLGVVVADKGDSEKKDAGQTAHQDSSSAVPRGARDEAHVIIPAGRGVYAHTVTATDSDLAGEIILEADSGPIAGDRLVGTVSRASGHEQLLVVRVNKIMHKGKTLNANGFVVAPGDMKGGVATSVDPLVFQRFILPAAAAFVNGLGQAIEQTSNTEGSYSALGNLNYVQRLNLGQQMGVAAGTAAAAVQNSVTQDMPTQSRINLAANVSVGVMFEDNVTDKQ